MIKSGYQRCPNKKALLKKIAILTGKHLCWSLFLIKLQVYPVNLPIQSECRKIRTRKNSVFGLRSEIVALFFHFYNPRKWASMDELYLKVKLEAQPFTGVLPNSCCKKIFGIRKNHSWWKQFYVKFSVCNVTRKTTPSLLFGWILQYSQEQFLCSTLTGMVVHLLQN